MFWLFVIVVLALVGYAVYSQYTKTPEDLSIPGRVWASIIGAAGVASAAVAAWLKTGVSP